MTRRRLSTLLIVAGALLLAEALLTVAWQEPASGLYAGAQQRRLTEEIARAERAARPAARDLRPAARRAARRARPGDAVARLEIPAIGVRAAVVEGTEPGELRSGPGHYPQSSLPGAGGTVAIAGHRTTYGAPFRRLDDLRRGDRIVLRMPYGRVAYRVEGSRVVAPDASWVTRPAGRERLVLTACHPLYSADRRIVVFARRAGA